MKSWKRWKAKATILVPAYSRTWESIFRIRNACVKKDDSFCLLIFRLQTCRGTKIERVFFFRFDSLIECLTAIGSLLAEINCQLA